MKALFLSGIDHLYIDGGFLVNLEDNKNVGYEYLKDKQKDYNYPNKNAELLKSIFLFKNKALREEIELKGN